MGRLYGVYEERSAYCTMSNEMLVMFQRDGGSWDGWRVLAALLVSNNPEKVERGVYGCYPSAKTVCKVGDFDVETLKRGEQNLLDIGWMKTYRTKQGYNRVFPRLRYVPIINSEGKRTKSYRIYVRHRPEDDALTPREEADLWRDAVGKVRGERGIDYRDWLHSVKAVEAIDGTFMIAVRDFSERDQLLSRFEEYPSFERACLDVARSEHKDVGCIEVMVDERKVGGRLFEGADQESEIEEDPCPF